jgi:hypothetical protein
LAVTLAYDACQSSFVVMSSLKFVMSCDTCVRGSPLSCAAAGSCVSWLSVSRASVNERLAASGSDDPAAAVCDGAGADEGGCAEDGLAGADGLAAAGVAGDVIVLDVVVDAGGVDAGVAGLAPAGSVLAAAAAVVLSGLGDVPLIPAANAVRWLRTSMSFVRVPSSSVTAVAAFEPLAVVPLVPAVAGGADVAAGVSLPTSVARILSAAAMSVAQFADLSAEPFVALVASLPAARSSAVMCRLRSAICVLVRPVTADGSMLSSAAFACRRCSCGDAAVGLGVLGVAAVGGCGAGDCCAAGGCWDVGGGAACAQPLTGRPISAAAAKAVVNCVERFIGGSS